MAMTLTEKAAYIKGLADGLNLDADKPETKIINALLDLVDDMALSVCDLEDELALVGEQVDAVDEDLDALESYVYDDDDCDCCCDDDCDCCDDDFFEVECPACGEIIYFDDDIDPENLTCPACHEKIACLVDEDDLKIVDGE